MIIIRVIRVICVCLPHADLADSADSCFYGLFGLQGQSAVQADNHFRDSADNIIYNVYVILPASTYMMILPAGVNAAKYKIELIYGDHHLMGYF